MAKTKEHIMGVALKLFLQKNFKEVTMKEIVTKTGMSKGAFYHYFESKEKLFLEIVNLFFSSLVKPGFNDCSNESLYRFYHDCLNRMDTLKILFHDRESDSNYFNMNFFFMMFDAIKLFPEFREKMKDYNTKELDAWTKVIKRAKETGEIKSSMSDKQIAMIFIHTSDGIAMHLALGGRMDNLKNELKSLWDKFYEGLKT